MVAVRSSAGRRAIWAAVGMAVLLLAVVAVVVARFVITDVHDDPGTRSTPTTTSVQPH